jgi:peptide/nickel transport system permease protein
VLTYVVRRVAWGVVLFFTATIFTFVVFFVIPTQHEQLGRNAEATSVKQNASSTRISLGEQYVLYLHDLRHGSLGRSWTKREKVTTLLGRAIPVTAALIGGGMVFWLLLALPAGIVSALRPRSLLDRGLMIVVLICVSLHPVWIGSLALYLLGFRLHLVPIGGYCRVVNPQAGCGGLHVWAWHLLLPWLTFASVYAALYTRMIRASVLDVLGEDYVRTAVANGGSTLRVLRSHVLPNALLPIVTMLGMDVGIAFGGTIFIERVFGLPGLGTLAYQGLVAFDLPLIVGVVSVLTVAIVTFNLIVDLLYAVLDPRIRLARRRREREFREPAPQPARSQPAQARS